jgi:hypothetical protein
MSNFTFKLPNGESFEIKMPGGATFEQAQAVFKQQVDSGGLTGFKVGDALSAATQAADGLSAAASQAQQGLASALGKLPSGTDLSSLTAGIGPAAAGAANQLTSALTGAGPAIASLTTGASSALNGAISGITSSLPGAISSATAALPGAFATAQANLPGELAGLQSKLPAAIGALTGQAAQIGSIANNAIKNLSGAISGTPLNGINVADFAKQGPSLGPIGSLDTSMVTGALAQASKLVGQASDALSNSLGAGKFGFDAGQLEKAGFLKPGTAAEFLAAGEAELTSVLKSPLPWTGKDGVKGIGDLLGNDKLQDKIQQGLMSSGLGDLKQLGLPTDKLNPQALAGLATNAAKSVSDTLAWAKNSPDLTANVKAAFDQVATNSAFAVKLTEGKVEPALKQEEPAPAATNTVNSDTVDAASKRIVGNDKVPTVTNNDGNSDARTKTSIYVAFVSTTYVEGQAILIRISNLVQNNITQDIWNQINQEFIAVKASYNARIIDVETAALEAITALGDTSEAIFLREQFEKSNNFIQTALFPLFDQIKKRIADLANKITV